MNPTLEVPLDFDAYCDVKEARFSEHLTNGVPDYAFSMDQQLRQRLNAMGPLRSMCKSMLSMVVPLMKQQLAMKAVAVGPNQYPEIYRMGEECARILGIGVPQIYVEKSNVFNAYAIAVDDNASVVVLYSYLIEHMTPEELMFIIGHECGHLHNLHGMYNTLANILMNAGANALLQGLAGGGMVPIAMLAQVLKLGIMSVMGSWSRCAEITCDRAGLICCKDAKASQTALSKLASGMDNVNLEELRKQVSTIKRSVLRFQEWQMSHPLVPKRVEAVHLFSQCETLFKWHPEMRGTAQPLTQADVDRKCSQLVSIFDKEYQVEV
jgi:Zn-dependent protease with chaperone function